MIAIDTNLLVRLLTKDDPQQAERATKVIKSGIQVFVAKTVLLETAWVLRSVYEFEAAEIAAAFHHLGGMQNIVIEDVQSVALALQCGKRFGFCRCHAPCHCTDRRRTAVLFV